MSPEPGSLLGLLIVADASAEERGLAGLADDAGVPRSTLWRVAAAPPGPRFTSSTLARVAKALRVTVDVALELARLPPDAPLPPLGTGREPDERPGVGEQAARALLAPSGRRRRPRAAKARRWQAVQAAQMRLLEVG